MSLIFVFIHLMYINFIGRDALRCRTDHRKLFLEQEGWFVDHLGETRGSHGGTTCDFPAIKPLEESPCVARPSCRAFCCRFWKPHRTLEVLPKFRLNTHHWSIFAGRRHGRHRWRRSWSSRSHCLGGPVDPSLAACPCLAIKSLGEHAPASPSSS
jgi:hypothetical protein